jgi:hypothetical protein
MTREEYKQALIFIYADVAREIALANAAENLIKSIFLRMAGVTPGGANFMAALALLSYTEFGGKLKYNAKRTNGKDFSSDNFNRFFDDLGDGYKRFRASFPDVYDIYRCGMVHEYYTKSDCNIYMLKKPDKTIGIGADVDGKLYIVVETYFKDLRRALDQLETQLFNAA